MAVLARAPEGLHGYMISQGLQELAAFAENPPDSAGLYRVLKMMEAEGMLTSEWNTEGSGPAKRVYRINQAGWDCLNRWAVTLEAYSENLRNTVEFIRKSFPQD
jgi:DNA-binding PadR family transcriptional regulator